jgi:hypothetical protein
MALRATALKSFSVGVAFGLLGVSDPSYAHPDSIMAKERWANDSVIDYVKDDS